MMRERERCDRGQPDAFGILQQAFIRRMAFNMTPTKFPTEQILIASILATIAFLLIYMVYVSIKKSREKCNNIREDCDSTQSPFFRFSGKKAPFLLQKA